MLMLKSKEMREKRAKLITDSRALLNGELTTEIRTQVAAMDTDIEAMEADIATYEKQEKRDRELVTQQNNPITGADENAAETRKKQTEVEVRMYSEAFHSYLRDGEVTLSPEQRATLKKGYVSDKENRAQTITSTGGGYTIPQGFQAELERAQLFFGGVRKLARILPTNGGNPLPWPTVDDTGNSGEDSTINAAATAQDVVFGQKTLGSYKMDSGLVLVPNELFEDTGLNLEGELGSIIGERIGRRQNNKYTLGAGTTTFQGITIGATLGLTFAGVAAITTDELIALQHKVDPAYRSNPKCGWEMNDDTIRYVRQLKDGQGRYVLDPALVADGLDKLLGRPIVPNQDMALLATGNKTVIFGDHSKFIIRDVRGIVVRRFNELFGQADQVGFLAFYRGDSQVVSASTKALVYAKQA